MRRLLAVLGVALVATACEVEPMSPADADVAASLEEMASLAYGVMYVAEGGPGARLMERLSRLPSELALSSAQATMIRGLIASFVEATEADRAALAAIRKEAAEARAAGKPPEEVRAILTRGMEARKRLHEAELALQRGILGVLTPAQREWLASNPPPMPRPCQLTDSQRTEISGLLAAFQEANAADIALVRSVHERARAAHQAGATRAEVEAILAEARPALERLKAAREAVQQAIQAVLTPEQRAAGCMR
jgi:Spy/CpxP family protein refolding chaperone